MIARGISVTVVSDGNPTPFGCEEIDGIHVTRISNLIIAPLVKKKKLLQAIMENKPDIVIWYGTPFSAIYLNRLKSMARPFIWDIDTDLYSLNIISRFSLREFFHPHHNFLLNPLLTAICPRFIIKSTANSGLVNSIVVPSQYLKDSLIRIGVEAGKIAVVPSTIETVGRDYSDAKHAKEESRRKLGHKFGEFVVTYYGSPCSLRGPDTAILSMSEILQEKRNVGLVILSRREKTESSLGARYFEAEEEYLKKLVKKLKLEDRVKIVAGILDRSNLMEYLMASDVIVLPFKIVFSEPPLSVLETMRLGKVIVSTNLNVLREILGEDRGILVEPGRPQELARAILFLAEHTEEAEHYSKKAQQYATSLPDWEGVAEQFISLLDETLNGFRSKPD
jgi:glycosyltransferase involved in cell wall biosynthesis